MRKVGAILLLLIFLTPTIGFCVHKHYCGDHLKEVNLFHDADESKCCGEFEDEFDCCSDEEIVFQLDEDYSSSPKVDIESPDFTVLQSFILVHLFDLFENEFTSYLSYKPPLLFFDHSVTFQTFLI